MEQNTMAVKDKNYEWNKLMEKKTFTKCICCRIKN